MPEVAATIPLNLKLEWIGHVLQIFEERYKAYEKAISELAAFYNRHGFKMMVLKGYGCSLDWPKPNHRPCGDIDIWLFGHWKDADAAVMSKKGIKIDTSHHHHTVFYWQDFMVENHYDFINVHHHKSNVEFERILKEQGQDCSYCIEVLGEKVYLPSPNLHALFLIKHACIEFAASGINLRQLIDWAIFVKKHGEDVDWPWLLGVLDRFSMRTIFEVFNGICVEDLGFEQCIFPYVLYDPQLKEKALEEMLFPKIDKGKDFWLPSRIVWKIRRWKANEWKHQLCYRESMWSAFCSGVWNHLQKLASI